ncbi:MAG: ATP-dependent 6-phosphofructokinase [Holosporales bacterium]|jgi:6-phosphofructokinase 1|nr:ATP-dependent 6-phosphofructokinase [Holosporales bacterium]
MNLKRIGILTSGGDCSGLNSVIRATFLAAKKLGYELLGFKRGLRGIAVSEPDYIVLNDEICDETLLTSAGSVINSDTRWMTDALKSGKTVSDMKMIIYNGYNALNLSGLICVGGDGSLRVLNELTSGNEDLQIVVIPKTIDNDVSSTDFAIGFQTAVKVVSDAIENVRSTAKSHERAMVIEVMGRDAGFIAMYAGIASGADVILVPEFKYDIEKVKDKVKSSLSSKKGYCLIVVAESVEEKNFSHEKVTVSGIVKYPHVNYKGIGQHISDLIMETGIDARAVVLGHIQRGGTTSVNDRLLGTMFGIEAVKLIDNNDCGKLLCYVGNNVISVKIEDVIKKNINKRLLHDDPYVKAAKCIGVYVGEV